MSRTRAGRRSLTDGVYLQIARQIDAGDYVAGDYLPSENSLCESFLVSRVTVRRALKQLADTERVISEPGRGWRVLASQPGYPLRGHEPIALVRQAFPEQVRIFEAARQALAQSGLRTEEVVVCGAGPMDLLPPSIAGAIVFSGADLPARLVSDAEARGIPIVCIGHEVYENYDCVSVDNFIGTQLMVEHVLDRGFRTIGFLSARILVERDPGFARRQAAYESTMSLRGLTPAVMWLPENVFRNRRDASRALAWVSGLREKADASVAVMCTSALLANGLLDTVAEAGIRVPEDVLISGFAPVLSEKVLAIHHVSSYPSVVQPCEELGRVAATLMIGRLQGNEAEPRLNLLRPQGVNYQESSSSAAHALET